MSHWTAATWAGVVAAIVAVLAAMGGVSRARRLRKPVVVRRARVPGHLLDYQLWPHSPFVIDPGNWQLARAVFQINNRSDVEQTVVLGWKPKARIWKRGMSLCAGRLVLPPQTGGWVGICVVVAEGYEFKERSRVLCHTTGRIGQSGKRIGYFGFARLFQYEYLDGADFRGGHSAPAKP